MSEMKITRVWWRILRPYRVDWSEAYAKHQTQAGGGPLRGEELQGPFYVMRSKVQNFLVNLPEASFFGISYKACDYVYQTRRVDFSTAPGPYGGKIIAGPPPPFYMARKADALMLKIACGGD